MIVYLASPYSHDCDIKRNFRFKSACMAVAKLVKQGVVVYSPIAHFHPVAESARLDGDFSTWQHQCLTMLDACTHMLVLMLPGWTESKGVNAEIDHCGKTGKPVIYSDFEGLARFDFKKILGVPCPD